MTRDEKLGRVLTLMRSELDKFTMPIGAGVRIPDDGCVWLRLKTETFTAQFSYSLDGITFYDIGGELPATVISDDHYYLHLGQNRFTGAFYRCLLPGYYRNEKSADFDYFCYEALKRM